MPTRARERFGSASKARSAGQLVGCRCTVYDPGFCLVMLQYSVSEALYGIDGDNGPYSALSTTTKLSS